MVISPSRTFVFHINRQQDVQESKQNKTKKKRQCTKVQALRSTCDIHQPYMTRSTVHQVLQLVHVMVQGHGGRWGRNFSSVFQFFKTCDCRDICLTTAVKTVCCLGVKCPRWWSGLGVRSLERRYISGLKKVSLMLHSSQHRTLCRTRRTQAEQFSPSVTYHPSTTAPPPPHSSLPPVSTDPPPLPPPRSSIRTGEVAL